MRRRFFVLTHFLLITTTVGAPVTPALGAGGLSDGFQPSAIPLASTEAAWPTVAANPQRTSWTPEEVPGKLKPLWFKPIEPYISQKVQLIAANGTIYISTARGLYAFEAETGQEKWFYRTTMPLGNSPTIDNGVAYVGGFDRKLHALDASTGQPLWTYDGAGAGFHTNPLAVGEKIYAGNRDGAMYAVYISGTQKGQLAWKYQTGGPVTQSAAYADGIVYFASNDMHAYALRAEDGSLVWKSEKLPGGGFQSYWPVVYRDFVVFSGGWNYRFPKPFPNANHNHIERDVFPSGLSAGDPMAPYGTEPGDWAAATRTMKVTPVTEYFEALPHRRTSFVLDRRTGREFTFDSDGDGRREYAPYLYWGAKQATRYPPAIGPDGVMYQPTKYIYDDWIPRGQIAGWKVGTPFISIPAPNTNAADEPLSYSIGGRIVYWRLMGEREAGSFDITGTGLGGGQSFGQGANTLSRTLPDLFVPRGWPYAYWKHGDQNPPVPYRGKVYMLLNNALVAFGPDGLSPGPELNRGAYTGSQAEELEQDTKVIGLNTHVTASDTTWPLLIRQETYYENRATDGGKRPRYMALFTMAASETSTPSSLTVSRSPGQATQLTTTFAGSETLKTWVSQLTPTVLAHTSGRIFALQGAFSGIAFAGEGGVQVRATPTAVAGADLVESWLLVWDQDDGHRWAPFLLSLEKRPSQIELSSQGIRLTFPQTAGYLAITPLYGLSDPTPAERSTWGSGVPATTAARARQMNTLAKSFPLAVNESVTIDPSSFDVTIRYQYSFLEVDDAWGTPIGRVAYLPPQLALAAWRGSPIRINGKPLEQHLDLNYPTPLGRVAGVSDTEVVTVLLPGMARYWREPLPAASPPSAEDPIQAKLVQEVEAMIRAGHLRPGYGNSGLWDTVARNGLGDNLADLWHNPADTIYTLIRTLPMLPPDVQSRLKPYIQSEFTAYPPHKISHIGWREGSGREAFDLPPEVLAEAASYPACTDHCNNGWDLPIQNFYALWLYAREFGGAETLFSSSKGNLRPLRLSTSAPSILNAHIQGHVGYLRLADLAGAGSQEAAERDLIQMLLLRAALSKNPESLRQTGFEYGGYDWTVTRLDPDNGDLFFAPVLAGSVWSQMKIYGWPVDIRYLLSGGQSGGSYFFTIDFVNLVPELSSFLRDYGLPEVQAQVARYNERAPYWFVARAEEGPGEGTNIPLYDVVAMFQAKAQILKESRGELEKVLDIPAFARGDLFYIQNLTAILEAGQFEPKPVVPSPVIEPAGGSFDQPITITLSSAMREASIRYTLDGSNPTEASTLYIEPVVLAQDATLAVRAFRPGYEPSAIVRATFAFRTTFADVPLTHPYHDEIEALYQAGYTAGCGTNPLRYCPDQAMTRAESAVFVERGIHDADVQPGQPAAQRFDDLPLSSWAAKWAEALFLDGYTAGCRTDPLAFCPWQGHTRAEGSVFFLRMLHGKDYLPPKPSGIFSDVPVDWWGAKWAEAAYNEGLIPACGEEPLSFCPQDPLTRGLAAFMMVRAKGLQP